MILFVAGTAAMGIDLSGIAVGDPVSLVAEPDNQYDPHAIKVIHGGRHVGYLQRAFAATHRAKDYQATVSAVLPHPVTGKPAGLRLNVERVPTHAPS